MVPEINKLRRFALGAGLILLTYSLAGIGLEPDAEASVFGIPFVISRPDLLPVGLIIASLYGLFRYYYYGIMLRSSPYHTRKVILSEQLFEVKVKGKKSKDKGAVFFGASNLRSTSTFNNRGTATQFAGKVIEAFPKLVGKKVSAKIRPYVHYDEEGNEHVSFQVDIIVPRLCRIAGFIQDIDYFLPVFLNIVALIFALMRLL